MNEVDAEFFGKMRRQPVEYLSFDFDPAVIGLVKAGQQLDQRRFAGAVLADETVNGAAPDDQRRTGQRLRAPESFDDAFEADDVVARRHRLLQGNGRHTISPVILPGRSSEAGSPIRQAQPMPSFLVTSPTLALLAMSAGT